MPFPEQEILEALECIDTNPWSGVVWRHMFADYQPENGNTRGARWNPKGVEAIYTALSRETAIAEGDFMVSLQPIAIPARRTLYEIEVTVCTVGELSKNILFESFEIDDGKLASLDQSACRAIGEAASWLGWDGLFIPSARCDGKNLVIFPANCDDTQYQFDVISSEVLFDPESSNNPPRRLRRG